MDHYIQVHPYDAEQFDDEWIILNADQFTVTKVNEVGGFCWGLLREAQTADSLTQAIIAEFATAQSETVEKDVKEFLADLIQCGLVAHVV